MDTIVAPGMECRVRLSYEYVMIRDRFVGKRSSSPSLVDIGER